MDEWIQLLKNFPQLAGAFVFVFGLLLGSFFNVCIVRLPREEQISKGRSHCPHCRNMIAWYDNIPLLSFIFLRAKCRHCAKPISWRYPLVELLTAVSFVLAYRAYGPDVKFLFFTYFISSLIIVTFVDFEHQIIPDEVSLTGILVGLTASYFFPVLHNEMNKRLALADSALGMLAGIGLIYGVAMLGKFLFRKEAMGGGDLKLLAMIGTFLGPEKTVMAFFLAPFFGAPIGLVLKITRQAEVIPFGPYLSTGAIVALIWGKQILDKLLGNY